MIKFLSLMLVQANINSYLWYSVQFAKLHCIDYSVQYNANIGHKCGHIL